MSQKTVLVIGSSNTDMVVKTEQFPVPGETVLGGVFLMNPGGKGANQAVAAARLGAKVVFITKVGKDLFGNSALEGFSKEGIDINHIRKTEDFASGVALITVNGHGENSIVVASGANMDLQPADIENEVFDSAEIILLQLEIPLDTVKYLIQKGKKSGKKVILNPAPASKLEDEFLDGLYLITPNETETHLITGILPEDEESLHKAGNYFREKGVQNVIITLGSKGVFLMNENYTEIIPANKVTPVDTTAAGDVFNGALLTALVENTDWLKACKFACKAASISVTRMGAQSSAPYKNEVAID